MSAGLFLRPYPSIPQPRSHPTDIRTLEDPHGSWVVVDSSCGLQRSCENRWRGDEIVCEGIVKVTLFEMMLAHAPINGSMMESAQS